MKKTYKLALITGGSSGIGLALAKELALEGTNLCILARDKVKLKKAKQEILSGLTGEQQKNQIVDILSSEITDYESLKQTLDDWMNKVDVPDLVINSAGVTYPGYFQEIDIDIFHWLMDINYYGTLHVLKCIIPKMIQQKSGTVVNISSQAGFAGVFGYSGYSASKYAVRGFSDVLRSEMKPLGIQVSVVFPPDTKTPQLEFEEPLKPPETRAIASATKPLSAEHVAHSIIRDVSRGRYVIIPGLDGKFFYRLVSILGNLVYPIVDWLISKAQKNIK
jgi:3-dehydrosphinganine reductase